MSFDLRRLTPQDRQRVEAMRVGGAKLRQVKLALRDFTQVGMSFADIEAEAQRLIRAAGATPNFALVPKYHWATCIMKNDEMCHGIPSAEKVAEDGDLITIDVGLLWQNYHLDTTISFAMGTLPPAAQAFVDQAQVALKKSIDRAVVGSTVHDVSHAMQKAMERHGYGMVYQLTGHGIGEQLHMEPSIPCVAQRSDKRVPLMYGQTLAVEVMATMGDPELTIDADGWTYRTKDHSMAVMFEETVVVGDGEPEVLT